MKSTAHDEYTTALDLAVVSLHWLANSWQHIHPGVASHLRKIADGLALKLKMARTAVSEKTEIVTRLYGIERQEDEDPPE
jgi:hypothetical protein